MKGYITLIVTSFFILVSYSQVSVIHFNSSWNSENSFDVSGLKDCSTSSIIICEEPDMQEQYKIKSVPTVIVFDEEIEVVRFEGGLMLSISATKKEIQKEISSIYLKKFE